MKRFIVSLGVFFLLPFMLFACNEVSIDIQDIDIEAINEIDVPAGTYTINYTIDELSDLIKNHGAIVSFTVTNKLGHEVIVNHNTFTVEVDEVYTVVIRLTIGLVYKEKTITVTAVTQAVSITVSFDLKGGTGSFEPIIIALGSTVSNLLEPTRDGFVFSGWYVDENCTTPFVLNQAIHQSIILYAKWEPLEVYYDVTFELLGGIGEFLKQTLPSGGYALRPTDFPTKEGYIFEGWFTSEDGYQPFDFQTTPIYSHTIIYAHWMIDQTPTYRVTYDLNGAFQSEAIVENVKDGLSPEGPSMEFVYAKHIFIGWSKDKEAEHTLSLNALAVTEDITLYAVWHVDFTVIDGSSYFTDYHQQNSSTIKDYTVEQRFSFKTFMHLSFAETQQNISESRVDYGMIYSYNVETPTYYSQDVTRINCAYDAYSSLMQIPVSLIETLPLESDKTYHIVFFARYESIIIYSEIYELASFINVDEGFAVGVSNVLNGGYYRIDTKNPNFKPAMYITVLEGYTALINEAYYTNYIELSREGIRHLVTIDNDTQKKYLHVFHLEFESLPVSLTLSQVISDSSSFNVQYGAGFPFKDDLDYAISEMGILYSEEHPFLKLGVPGVLKKQGSLNEEETVFTLYQNIYTSAKTIYIRGYINVSGNISYSRFITKLTYSDNDNIYIVSGTFDTNQEKVSPEFGFSHHYTPNTMRVYKVEENSLSYIDYNDYYKLTEEGQYFVVNVNYQGMIYDVLVIDDYPDVIGIEDLKTYQGSVVIWYDAFNPYWYYTYNNGDYVYLPSSIRLDKPGYYEVYYRTGHGIERIRFTII